MAFTAPESLSGQIAKYLAQRIIRGEMQSGERIQEVRVVNELNVSRGSVREALLILQRRRMVEILPRRGAQVAALTHNRVTSLYDLYMQLLTMLIEQVAVLWREDNIRGLAVELERSKGLARSDDHQAFIECGFAMMRAAFDIVGNPYLTDIMEDLQPAIYRTYALAVRYDPAETQRAAAFFSDLFAAALQRDGQRIPLLVKNFGGHQCELVLAAMNREASACA